MTLYQSVNVNPGKLLIGGEWTSAKSGKTFSTLNPATEKEITKVVGRAETPANLRTDVRHLARRNTLPREQINFCHYA